MAKWRRRIYRGLVAALLSGVATTGWIVYQTTSSAAVRQQVISHLRQRFTGAEVALGSAKLRLLGGITFSNLTLYRRDDPNQTPFLHVPAGVIYHDKEQLGQGRMVIRKIKFERPRLTVVRGPDGRWNMGGILGPVRPEVPIPIFEVVQGTVVVDLAEAPNPATAFPSHHMELSDVNGTLLNHPLAFLNFDLRGNAKSAGPMTLRGSWHRVQEKLAAAIELSPVPLGPATLRELVRIAPGVIEPIEQLGGVGQIHLDLQYCADSTPSWRHQLRAEVRQGRLVHRSLPFPVENLDLIARCDDGKLAIDSLTGTTGPARFTLKARLDANSLATNPRSVASMPADKPAHTESLLARCLEPFRALEFDISNWPVTPDLFDRLPASLAVYRQRFAPTGMIDMSARLTRTATDWTAVVSLLPTDMSFRFESFPYPLGGVRGRLDLKLTSDAPSRLDVDLTAEGSGRRPVTLRGYVVGSGPESEYAYDLGGIGLSIDEPLLQALPGRFQNIARSFHPRGVCDIAAIIRRAAGTAQPRQDYHVLIRDAALCYDVFPVPLTEVGGTLDIHLTPPGDPAGNRFEFSDFRAVRGGGRVVMSGTARPLSVGTQIDLAIRGQRIPLDEALGAAFGRMRLRTIWDMFAPTGRMDFDAELSHVDHPDGPPEFSLKVAPRGATICPSFFPYALSDLGGTFDITRTRVDLKNFSARHGNTELRVRGGSVDLKNGGYRADFGGLTAEPLPVNADFVRACPAALQAIIRMLAINGSLGVQVDRLYVDEPPHLPGPGSPPRFYWEGQVAFSDATLRTGVQWENVTGVVACRGAYRGHALEGVQGHIALDRASVFNQPLSKFHAGIHVDPKSPNEVRLDNVQARLYGGQLGGEARVAFGAGLQYSLNLQAVGVQLEEFARQNRFGKAQLNGTAHAGIYLAGAGTEADELEGAATVHADGKLYNLPVFLDLLKVLGLHSPDGTAFEEGHVEVAIHGKKLQVQRLDLLGNALSLGGRGDLNLDGSDLKLDFYAVWGHIVQILPPGLREIPPWLSKNLFKITARGKLGGQINYAMEPVPGVVDPVRQLIDRVQKRRTEPTANGPLSYTPRLKGS
jgi:hypothetical protein